jgi:hypothetical protein
MEKHEGINREISDNNREENGEIASYGLLVINHAYNEGKITFKEWLEMSREWAERVIRQHGKTE